MSNDELDDLVDARANRPHLLARRGPVAWFRSWLEAREAKAWHEGYTYADEEVDDYIAVKDFYITEQEQIILELMKMLTKAQWEALPTHLYQRLRDYA